MTCSNHLVSTALGALAVFATFTSACTTVIVRTDGGDVIGRTMELMGDLEAVWEGATHSRGEKMGGEFKFGRNDTTGEQVCGEEWTNRFGFFSVGLPNVSILGGLPQKRMSTDGMNEAGFSASVQVAGVSVDNYMKTAGSSKMVTSSSVCWLEMIPWLLGNFEDIAALKQAFPTAPNAVNKTAAVVDCGPNQGTCFQTLTSKPINPMFLGLHWAVDDAQGNHAVLEVLDGTMRIYDNTVGVMTNDPPYPWQLNNLNQYSALSPKAVPTRNAVAVQISEAEPDWRRNYGLAALGGFVPFNGQGFGFNLFGLPGSFSPADRFVRMFYLKQFSEYTGVNDAAGKAQFKQKETIAEGMVVASGLLANTFIVKGTMPDNTTTTFSLLKVPSAKEYFYKTYGRDQWKRVQIKGLAAAGAFDEGAQMSADKLQKPKVIEDVTDSYTHGTAPPTIPPPTPSPNQSPTSSCVVAAGFCVPPGTPGGGNMYCCDPLYCIYGVCNVHNRKPKSSKRN